MPRKSEKGQTLIETLVGAFIMVMGISAAVTLAVYAFGASTSISKQIVAAGLAREGIEMMKNMRDTNWLKLTISHSCYDFTSQANVGSCFTGWLDNGTGTWNNSGYDRGYRIDPGGATSSYVSTIDPDASNKTWNFNSQNSTKYGLDFNSNATSSSFAGFYAPSNTASGSSGFWREIQLSTDSSAPIYNQNTGPLLIVSSRVWWNDKKCTVSTTYAGASQSCKLEIRAYLTNWKDFQ